MKLLVSTCTLCIPESAGYMYIFFFILVSNTKSGYRQPRPSRFFNGKIEIYTYVSADIRVLVLHILRFVASNPDTYPQLVDVSTTADVPLLIKTSSTNTGENDPCPI